MFSRMIRCRTRHLSCRARFGWQPQLGSLLIAILTLSVSASPMSALESSESGRTPVPNESRRIDDREEAGTTMRNGNWNDAYVLYRKILLDPSTDSKETATDLSNAIQCLQQLGRLQEVDELLESTIEAHGENWRLLQTAARQYTSLDHNGFLIGGKFERGGHRGGGKAINSLERDRVRSLQLMMQAIPLANDDDNKQEVASFYYSLADALLYYRGWAEAWRLQSLTNLGELPDYDEGYGYFYYRQGGAPVDAEGNPIFHASPDSFETAKSDGERWRWALAMSIENNPEMLNTVRNRMADFSRAQFGVPTLNTYGWIYPPRRSTEESEDEDESGTYALHTLGENETIARLATGIKRFELPDDYNFIKIYQEIAAEPRGGNGESAYTQLSQIHEDRRQYKKAAEYWRTSIRDYGDRNNWKKQRLDQIIGNWGRFETGESQAAGEPAVLQYRFRNGGEVELTAHRIDIENLVEGIKTYIKGKPQQVNWNQINLQNIGYQLSTELGSKYVKEEVAKWTVELDPRENHFDRRVTIETPLEEAGAYQVVAKMKDGNSTTIVVWISDASLSRVTAKGKSIYYVADAVDGTPLPRANVEFFGFRQEPIQKDGRYTGSHRVLTTNFADRTDADGLLSPDPEDEQTNFQYLIVARAEGRAPAIIGFQGVWHGHYYDQEYNQLKTFFITDRPVYRPGHEVQVKAWIRQAQYDRDAESQFANRDVVVRMTNPKGEQILTESLKSDSYGGVTFTYKVPADATLGQYYLSTDFGGAAGGNTFRVEEYKKPEYEVTIDAPTEPIALGETFKATINANYYFGAPVTNATVKYKVLRTNHDKRWYPFRYWDWCYSPGYWWFCYEYPWYPGFYDWVGCRTPYPWWWWQGPSQPPEVVAEQEVKIGIDGKYEIEIDTAVAKEMHGDTDHQYTITAEVRDQSRRTIVGQGEVLVSRRPFKVYTWVDKGYYQVGDTIQADFLAQTIARKPVEGTGTLTLLKITYDAARAPIETPVRQWDLDTDTEGRAEQQIKASRGGQYRLSYELTDSEGHDIEGGYLFTVIGEGFDGSDFRFNHVELIPDKQEYSAGDAVSLQVNTDHEDSTVLLFVRPANGVYLDPKVLRLEGKSTVAEIDVIRKDMPNFFVEAVTVANGKVHSAVREIIVPPESRVLNVEVTPSQEEYRPGEKSKVKIRVTDHTGENFQGQTVVSIYDKAVEYISGGSNTPEIREFFWKWRRSHNPNRVDSLARYFQNIYHTGGGMNDLGMFGATVVDDLNSMDEAEADANGVGASRNRDSGAEKMQMRGAAQANEGFAMADAAPGAPSGGAFGGGGGGAGDRLDFDASGAAPGDSNPGQPLIEPSVRSRFADTALWVGVLETDSTGVAEVELDMPENLTTWKVKVWAMGHGTKVGAGEVEVITTKDLLVRMQAPRFFVEKDEVVLSANVHNYLDEAKQVTVRLELDGSEIAAIDDLVRNVSVPADGETRVDWRVRVQREGTATVRMFALTDEESDAMEMTFPVYVHGMQKQEAWAGTVRPTEATAEVSFMIPEERRPEQSRLEIRYSPTLAGAMVDSLPYLANYPYGCTEQTLNRWLPTVITQKILLDMNLDLEAIRDKRTNLNAQELGDDRERATQWKRFDDNPVFSHDEVDRMVKEGLKRLAEMQVSDGGWGWFSGYREYSLPHTTAVVVHGLQIARQNDVALVPGMLENGIGWLQRYQAGELQKLKNAEEEIKPYKTSADNMDAFVYMVLVDEDLDSPEMREFLYRDRNNLSVYSKSVFGLALHKMKDEEKLNMIMENISQYLVQDEENESAYLELSEGNYWWYWYGDENEAMANYLKLLARTDVENVAAPRLVKYLLNNRKHGTYWKSTRDTAQVVEAFAEYIRQSEEDQPDMVVEIWLDGEMKKEVSINSENLFTFDNKFVLEGELVTSGDHLLEIKRQGKGPVYFNVYSSNFTLEDYITEAGLEVKVNRKYYKLVPVEKEIEVEGSRGQVVEQKVEKFDRIELSNLDVLQSGDLVEVELLIESKNDYEYLLFEDMKPAGFEAVDLRSGYNGNEMGAYAEFRDNRASFFVQRLARGNHSLSYRLRAEIPGRFSALPARAEAMYAPELKGNSNELKFEIVDGEE